MNKFIFTLIIIALISNTIVLESAQLAPEDTVQTKIVMLGSGSPNPQSDRFGPCLAIVVNEKAYLVDCGVGLSRRANAAFKSGIEALKVKNLNICFITHLHADHTMGLPDLMLTPWIMGREEPLILFGPEGLKDMAAHISIAYEMDIDVRLNGMEPISPNGYKINAIEIDTGIIYSDGNIRVFAFPVQHGEVEISYGFRFETPDKVIIISGDCRPSESLIENSHGCDVLIHEVYSYRAFLQRPEIWQKYHSYYHTSTIELGKIAKKIAPKLLIGYHVLNWGSSDEEMILEIKQNFDGNAVIAKDLEVY